MSNYRNRLLGEVCDLCQQLLARRVAVIRTQGRVSDTARSNTLALQDGFGRLIVLHPFPDETTVDESPLAQLKTALSAADTDPGDNERILLDWIGTAAPPPAGGLTTRVAVSPLNQRMLDATARMRRSIDATRVRLLLDGDTYDKAAYRAARNEFTLTRAALDQRLQSDTDVVTVADAVRAETVLTPAIDTASGTEFPNSIQEAADFMRVHTFVFHPV